jgi:ribosome-binding protein aMBF1 (putative translation factor)
VFDYTAHGTVNAEGEAGRERLGKDRAALDNASGTHLTRGIMARVDLQLVKHRTEVAKRLGESLRSARITQNLQQLQIANRVGISRSLVSHVEHGTRRIRRREAPLFAEVYGVPLSVILEAVKEWEDESSR